MAEVPGLAATGAIMSKPVEEILQAILDEFASGKQSREELEAKALFRLLNYCPPRELENDATCPGFESAVGLRKS
jgi:hypothetical protein